MKHAKRVLTGLLAAVALVVFAGCGGADTSTPTGAFDAGIKAVKSYNKDGIAKYFEGVTAEDLTSSMGGTSAFDEALVVDLVKTMYEKLDCKVVSESVEDATATLTVEVKWLDPTQLQQNYISAVLSSSIASDLMSGKTMTEEMQKEALNVMKSAISKTGQGEASTKQVQMVKENGQWKISQDALESLLQKN